MDTKKIIYGFTPEGLIFILEARAEELASLNSLLNSADETWGELRKSLPKELYEAVLRMSDQYEGPWRVEDGDLSSFYLSDDTIYTEEDVFNFQGSGISPGHPEIEMSQWIPLDIQDKYGKTGRYYRMDGSAPKGNILDFEKDKLDKIIQMFEVEGYHCRRDNELVNHACGYLE